MKFPHLETAASCLRSLHANVAESTVRQEAREPHPASTPMDWLQAVNLTKQSMCEARGPELGEEELLALQSLMSVRSDFL